MAIGFVCPECGGRLRVPAAWGRMRVACPDCRALLTAPAPEDAAPADAVPVAESAGAAPPGRSVPAGPAPPPDALFTFHDPAPDGPAAASPGLIRTPGRGAGSRLDWSAFGSGCGLARIGTWVELAAVAALLGPLLAALLGLWVGVAWGAGMVAKLGPFGLLPFFGLMLSGAVLIGLGRLRMRAVPPGTGAGGVLTGALVLSAVRAAALVAGLGLAAAAGFELKAGRGGGAALFVVYAAGGYAVAVVAGVVADVTALPGLAVLGGAIPSEPLRRRVGLAAFLYQLVAALTVAQLAAAYVLVVSGSPAGLAGRLCGPAADRRPNPPPAEARPAEQEGGLVMLPAACGVVLFALLCQVGYAALHDAVYAAGQRATARDAPKDDAAGPEA